MMSQLQPYSYVRYTWWKTYSVEELVSKLKDRFTVIEPQGLKGESLSPIQGDIPKIEVKADTLVVYVAPSRAVLSQKESKPFTKRDMELREIVLSLYPHATPGPLPFFYRREPKFQTTEIQ